MVKPDHSNAPEICCGKLHCTDEHSASLTSIALQLQRTASEKAFTSYIEAGKVLTRSQGKHFEGRVGGSEDSSGDHTPPPTPRNTNNVEDLYLCSLVFRRACDGMVIFATLNLPTCHWQGCSRALNPRRSGTSAALIDEPGSDSQKLLDPLWPLGGMQLAPTLEV